jgi:lipopolysaccharide/colanic/teichoic acid biosynthesis glycosyltransferase
MTTLADQEHRVEIADLRPHHHLVPVDRRLSWYEHRGKRALDVVVSATLVVVLAPLMLVITLLLRITLGPGVVLHQQRTGLHGRDFTMFKFRTMRPDRRHVQRVLAHPDRRRTHKSANDPRHTRLGRALRRTSLDELPQLFNVLRGDMSLVGPRPELAHIVEARHLRTHPRHQRPPGVTGHWQIGRRNEGVLLCDCLDDVPAPPTFTDDVRTLVATLGVMWRRSGG